MDVKLQPYKKKQFYSYTYGVYPTLQLLYYRPGSVIKVLLSTKGKTNQGVKKIVDICAQHSIKTEVNDGAINKLSESENNYALGIFNKYQESISPTDNHIVLINPGDFGNLGTIIRTMVAFNAYNLSVITPAADIFHPKTIRASMGEIFHLHFELFDLFEKYRKCFPSHHIYPLMTDAKTPFQEINFRSPYAIVFGNEGQGLSKSFRKTGTPLAIPQNKDVDSLNLSIASGIVLFHLFAKNIK